MAIEISKLAGLYHARITPPHSRDNWSTVVPITEQALIQKANELGVHVQDFWDAMVLADPSIIPGG